MTTEAEWDRESRAQALGLDLHDALQCPCGCGYPMAVSQNPENEGRFKLPPPTRCHAQTAIVLGKRQYDDESVSTPEALLFERPELT